MKILYLSSASDWHIDLWTQFFAKEHSVYLFSDNESYLQDQPFRNVKVRKSQGLFGKVLNSLNSKSHKLSQINKFVSARYYARQIDRLIRDEEIEIVHAHNLYYGFVASFMKSDLPLIFTPMGSDVIVGAQTNLIYRHMAKRAFHRADVITSDSFLLQRKGFDVGAREEKNYVIQNGVDSSVFYPKPNSLREEFQIDEDEILLFSPRAITPLYNIDTIINSLGMLKDANLRFRCMFSYAFGDEYHKGLKERVSVLGLDDQIIWLGYVSYEDMQVYYNACDLVISVPSSDSSPKSVYEAMFCGKPVIVSDLEWSYEFLNDDSVFRVGVRDPVGLANAIKKLISDSQLADNLAKNSLRLAHQYYDYEKNMKHMEELMKDSIRQSQ